MPSEDSRTILGIRVHRPGQLLGTVSLVQDIVSERLQIPKVRANLLLVKHKGKYTEIILQ